MSILRGYYTGCVASGNMGDDILFHIFVNILSNTIKNKYNIECELVYKKIQCSNINSWYNNAHVGIIGGGSILHPEEKSYSGPIEYAKKTLKSSFVFGTGISDTPRFKISDTSKEIMLSGNYDNINFPINNVMLYNIKVVNDCKYGGLRGPLDVKIAKSCVNGFNKSFIYDPGLLAASYLEKSSLLMPETDKLIGINLAWVSSSNRIGLLNEKETDGAYNNRVRQIVIEFCKFALDSGYSLFFYPMSHAELGMHLHMLNTLGTDLVGKTIFYIDKKLSNEDMIRICSRFRIVLATRLHANILANSSAVPNINLMYNYKAINYQESIQMRNYCIPLNKQLTYNNVVDKFLMLESNYDTVKQNIRNHINKAISLHSQHINNMLSSLNFGLKNVKLNYCVFNNCLGIFEINES